MSVALITGLELPRPTPEGPVVAGALGRLGIDAEIRAWRGVDVDWESYDLLVLSTPWDYSHHPAAFLAWVAGRYVPGKLENPAAVVAWTSHKRYLRELAAAGVPTVPTVVLDRGSSAESIRTAAAAAGKGQGTYDVIVKPAVAAGGRGMVRAGDPATAAAHAQRLLDGGDAILQPFAPEVLSHGETSLIFFDGRYSHAVRKRAPPRASIGSTSTTEGASKPMPPSAAELAVARAAIACAPAPTLYARVDLIGVAEPRVGELELVEPELFLRLDPEAPGRYAEAIRRRLPAAGRPAR